MKRLSTLIAAMAAFILIFTQAPAAGAITLYINRDYGGNFWQYAAERELSYGDYDKQVQELKQDLEQLGYRIGSNSYWFNYATKRAVRQFQRDNNLPVTGVADEKTLDIIKQKLAGGGTGNYVSSPQPGRDNIFRRIVIRYPDRHGQQGESSRFETLKYGSYGSAVLQLETWLDSLGYDPGKVSRYFSVRTYLAVREFQKGAGLDVTGVVDRTTWQRLQEAAERGDNGSDNPDVPPVQPVPETGNNGSGDGTTAQADNSDSLPAGLTAEERQMINLVNRERVERGLAPLKVDMELVRTARLKSRDMVDNNYFAHQSPTYGSPFDMMRAAGIRYRYAGENLAGAPRVDWAHRNLMNSPGHRANILNPNYTHIGIGIVDGSRYGKIFTQHFTGK